jgi:hypothetical protein
LAETIRTVMSVESVESLDQALASIKELEERLGKLESENSKLKATKQGLMSDLKKKKAVDSFLKVAGIDLKADSTEEDIAEQIASLRAPVAAPAGQSADDSTDSAEASSSSAQPSQEQPPVSQQQPQSTPSDAMNAAVEAKLTSLQKQNEKLGQLLQQITKERDQERAQRREARLEQKILDELAKAECRRPRHLFKLERENFDLLDDEDTVMYKVGDELLPLRDAITKLKGDDEYSVYFNGSGATGSGLAPSRASAPIAANNPFAAGSVNATQAAAMMAEKPEQARQLINQARAAGKLDPTMDRVFGVG